MATVDDIDFSWDSALIKTLHLIRHEHIVYKTAKEMKAAGKLDSVSMFVLTFPPKNIEFLALRCCTNRSAFFFSFRFRNLFFTEMQNLTEFPYRLLFEIRDPQPPLIETTIVPYDNINTFHMDFVEMRSGTKLSRKLIKMSEELMYGIVFVLDVSLTILDPPAVDIALAEIRAILDDDKSHMGAGKPRPIFVMCTKCDVLEQLLKEKRNMGEWRPSVAGCTGIEGAMDFLCQEITSITSSSSYNSCNFIHALDLSGTAVKSIGGFFVNCIFLDSLSKKPWSK